MPGREEATADYFLASPRFPRARGMQGMDMEFDDIAFTEWQIGKVRVALNKYRISKASNGRLPSWKHVQHDITVSDQSIDRYSENNGELALYLDSLRRFATGVGSLQRVRLHDISRFLMREGMLRLEDMEESNSGETSHPKETKP